MDHLDFKEFQHILIHFVRKHALVLLLIFACTNFI